MDARIPAISDSQVLYSKDNNYKVSLKYESQYLAIPERIPHS